MTTATQQAIGADRRSADRGEDSYAEAHGRAGNGSGGRGPLPDSERLARRLGWFSIGLGLAQITAPRSVARMIGVDDDDTSRNTPSSTCSARSRALSTFTCRLPSLT